MCKEITTKAGVVRMEHHMFLGTFRKIRPSVALGNLCTQLGTEAKFDCGWLLDPN